jgi:hypothetical protein
MLFVVVKDPICLLLWRILFVKVLKVQPWSMSWLKSDDFWLDCVEAECKSQEDDRWEEGHFPLNKNIVLIKEYK